MKRHIDLSRRGFIGAGAALAASSALRWSPSYAQEPQVLNYLSWPGNADPYLVAAFVQENNCKVAIKEYVGGDQMLAVINQSPPGSFDVVLADAEYLHLLHEAGADTPSIPVRVTDLSYLGDVMQVHLATNWNQDLDIRLPLRPGAAPDWRVGATGHLSWVAAHSQVHAAA